MSDRNKDRKIAKAITEIAVKGVQEKKGRDIIIIDLQETHGTLFDYFLVCTGNSPNQVDAIVESIEKEIKEATGLKPKRVEGLQNSLWVLMDYFDVIIHVMLEEARDFYRIEEMWSDAPQRHIENLDD